MTIDYLVKTLELSPHPEGGYFKETYRSENKIVTPEQAFPGGRNFSTAIYFLIEKNNFSALHRIKSDETWHFYSGDALEVIEINEAGELNITTVGNSLENGEVFQYTVKANTWFGSRVKEGGNYSLVGCTVAPGFDFKDFEMAKRSLLIKEFPQHALIIEQITRT